MSLVAVIFAYGARFPEPGFLFQNLSALFYNPQSFWCKYEPGCPVCMECAGLSSLTKVSYSKLPALDVGCDVFLNAGLYVK